MARNVQLGQMLSKLRAEIGDSQSVSLGVNVVETYKAGLRRVQETLWYDTEWPFLQHYVTDPIAAGTQYQAYPAGMSFERAVEAWTKFGGDLIPVSFGITPEHMNIHDSNAGQRAFPIQAWKHASTSDGYEVWPVPTSDTTMVFKGTLPLKPFVADADLCTLDDQLIVLFYAAEILSARSRKDGEAKLSVAQTLLRRLKGAQGAKKRQPFVMGGGAGPGQGEMLRPGIDYVV